MRSLCVLCLLIFTYQLSAQKHPELLKTLDRELGKQQVYVREKQKKIKSLKDEIVRNSGREPQAQFDSYLKLFEEYNSFQYDSAYYFLDRAKETALKLDRKDLLAKVQMKEGLILLSSGLFMEAVDSLNNIEVSDLSKGDRYDYYFTKARLYYDLADYNNDQRFHHHYIQQGNKNIGEALRQSTRSSADYWAAEGLKRMKQQQWIKAQNAFLKLINEFALDSNDFAVAASSLSYVYLQMGLRNESKEYLVAAAIADLKAATKENVALRNLANELYLSGNIEKANDYVHKALEDATFYNARHRKMEISSILPIIEGAQLLKVEQKNSSLQKTVILLALLALIVLAFLFIIFKQLKERNAARKELSLYNLRLEEMNRRLQEADTIKQDYITYFITATSQLFSKIGHFQASTIQKIKTRQPEEVLNVVQKYSIKQDRKDLFRQFDEVFLKLFPSFIEDFQALFPGEYRKPLKKNSLLNKEQRIFALFRLGIQDSKQIAEFMDLSVATIYSYKTRMKSRAYRKETFEEDVLKISSLS